MKKKDWKVIRAEVIWADLTSIDLPEVGTVKRESFIREVGMALEGARLISPTSVNADPLKNTFEELKKTDPTKAEIFQNMDRAYNVAVMECIAILTTCMKSKTIEGNPQVLSALRAVTKIFALLQKPVT